MLKHFLQDESGATAIDYALLAAIVAIGSIVTLEAMGASISDGFRHVVGKISAKVPK